MKPSVFGILCFIAMNCFPLFFPLAANASSEPQTIDPKSDATMLNRFNGLWVPGTTPPDIFNLLIVGQDDAAGSGKNPRAPLSSRSDIIMVVSFNRLTKKHNILSVFRDHSPSGGCEKRIGNAPDDKVNGVYSIQGRRGFIPCLEGMLEEMIGHLPHSLAPELLDRAGRFKIHAFLEGTRSQTIKPLGQDITAVVSSNKAAILSTFGVLQTTSALAVVIGGAATGTGPAYLLGSTLSTEEAKKMVDPKYLTVELKERKVYPAGGYQRAFNFATSVATILGWSAYGINQWKAYNFDFLGKYFGAAVNKNMSRSVDFVTLEKEVFMRAGDHLLLHACYKDGHTPMRVIQWGETASAYSIYSNGKIFHSPSASSLRSLAYVDILPAPSNCN